MKINKVVHVIIVLVLSSIGIFIGITDSIESPPYQGENLAILSIIILNSLWLLIHTIFCYYKRTKSQIVFSYVPFSMILIYMVFNRFYITPFDSTKWKSELNYNHTYGNHPAHKNGEMVEDIIVNGLLIGLSKEEVIRQLGSNYFSYEDDRKYTLYYFYSGKSLFNGCDKLSVIIHDGKCVSTDYAGCD